MPLVGIPSNWLAPILCRLCPWPLWICVYVWKNILWHSVVLKHQSESHAYRTKVSTLGTFVLIGGKLSFLPLEATLHQYTVQWECRPASSLHSLLIRTPRCAAWSTSPLPTPTPQCAPQNRNNTKLQSLCNKVQQSCDFPHDGDLGAHLCIHGLYYLKAGFSSRPGCFTKLCYLS